MLVQEKYIRTKTAQMLKKISPQLNIAEVVLPDLEEFQEKPEQVLVCRQTFEVTGIWQIFSAFYERFRIPPTFFIYVFLLVFSEASCGFSLKSLFFLKTYFFLKNYSLERPYLQSSFFFFSPILTLLSCIFIKKALEMKFTAKRWSKTESRRGVFPAFET